VSKPLVNYLFGLAVEEKPSGRRRIPRERVELGKRTYAHERRSGMI
jgi:hypothetical protein